MNTIPKGTAVLPSQGQHGSSLHDLSFQEVHADGLLVVLGEDPLAVALDHAGLAHRSVPHHHHLDGHLHVLLQHGALPLTSVPLVGSSFASLPRERTHLRRRTDDRHRSLHTTKKKDIKS